MNQCVWVDTQRRTAAEQMAIDTAMVAVAEREGIALLRLYRWSVNTVSFGANESALRHWNRLRLEADGLGLVRRPTGGRAVWHDTSDLTYAWAGAAATPAEVRRIYRDLHQRLAAAIAQHGGEVALASPGNASGLGPGACFDVPVGGEVLVDGRKTIGSAQRVYGKHLLQHGAIAVRGRQGHLAQYRILGSLRTGAEPEVTLGRAEELGASVAMAWRREGAAEVEHALQSRIVLASVEHRSQYEDPAWTWRR